MKYSEQDAIKTIQLCHEKFGDIDSHVYRNSGLKPSLSYILRYFGTWNQIVRKAGFIPIRNRDDEMTIRINTHGTIIFNTKITTEIIKDNNTALIGYDAINKKIGFRFAKDDLRGLKLIKVSRKSNVLKCSAKMFFRYNNIDLEKISSPYKLVYNDKTKFYVSEKI